ncbi:MAG: tail fiber protein [Actinomycetota bacterium]|nr:tail fiber protein [Actinomycetota bacterium]
MTVPFMAEIRLMSFNFVPRGWAVCDGQLLPINQNQALFALLGTFYGGNGQTNFALPDLRGCVPIHVGNGHLLGEKAGAETHTVTSSQEATHTHVVSASPAPGNTPGNSVDPMVLASPLSQTYRVAGGLVAMEPSSVSATGGSQPHNNMAPYLTLMFCIALQGVFPSRN